MKYWKEDKDEESGCSWKVRVKGSCFPVCHLFSLIIVNDVCGYWSGFQRIGKRMKDLAVVLSRGLLSEVLLFFTLVLFSINRIAWSLSDGDFGFWPRDLVCWTRLVEFLSKILADIQFLSRVLSIISVIFHNGNIKGSFVQFLVCWLFYCGS